MEGYNEEVMFDKIKQNSEIAEITNYIYQKYPRINDKEYAKIIAKRIYNNYSKNQVLSGQVDRIIERDVNNIITRNGSIVLEMNVDVDLQVKEKEIDRKRFSDKFKKALLIASAAAITLTAVATTARNKNLQEITNTYVDDIAKDFGENHSDNIEAGILEQNGYVSKYIANDLLSIGLKSPEAFDVAVRNTYPRFNNDRLKNMDEIFGEMQKCLGDVSYYLSLNNVENEQLNNDFNNLFAEYKNNNLESSFSDFLIQKGYLYEDDMKTKEMIDNYVQNNGVMSHKIGSGTFLDYLVSNGVIQKESIEELVGKYDETKNFYSLTDEEEISLANYIEKHYTLINNRDLKEGMDILEELVDDEPSVGGR